MLCLSRNEGQTIRVGADVVITLCRSRKGKARIGIQAPAEVRILRGELPHDAMPGPNRPAAIEAHVVIDHEAEVTARIRREADEREAAEWQEWAERKEVAV